MEKLYGEFVMCIDEKRECCNLYPDYCGKHHNDVLLMV